MPPISPEKANRYLGNGFAGVLLIIIGAGFIGVPLQDGIPLGLFHNGYSTVSFLLFELVGVALVAGGIWFLFLWRALGRPEVEISGDLRPGGIFDFRYKQRVMRRLQVRAIDIFLVYREKVEWGISDPARYLFDRLITRQSLPAGSYRPGERIDLACRFRLPDGEMGLRNPYMHMRAVKKECIWVARVRVQFGQSSEIWEDHEIEVARPSESSAQAVEDIPQIGLYDVLLLPIKWQNTISISKALKEAAPHLFQSGVPYAQHKAPNLIRERVDEKEAAALAERLRQEGAAVNIIPTEATWRLAATNEGPAKSTESTKE